MKFISKTLTWTDAMKDFAETSIINKLDRLITQEQFNDVEIKIQKIKNLIKVDIAFESYRVQSTGEDFYTILPKTATKLKNIIIKNRKSIKSKKLKLISTNELTDNLDSLNNNVTKEKIFIINPTTLESAIDYFEKTDYQFYIFKDIDNNEEITIIYKRKDSTYGLIRCR